MPRFSLPEDVALSCFLRGLKAGIGDSLWCRLNLPTLTAHSQRARVHGVHANKLVLMLRIISLMSL